MIPLLLDDLASISTTKKKERYCEVYNVYDIPGEHNLCIRKETKHSFSLAITADFIEDL